MVFDPTGPSLAYSKFSAQHLPHSEYLTKIRSYYSLDTKQCKLSLPPQWQSESDKRTENRISNSQLSVSALGGWLPGSKVHSHMKTWFCLFVFLCDAGDRTQGLTNIRQSTCRTTPPSQMCFIQNAQCWNIIEIWNFHYFRASISTKTRIHIIQLNTSLAWCVPWLMWGQRLTWGGCSLLPPRRPQG